MNSAIIAANILQKHGLSGGAGEATPMPQALMDKFSVLFVGNVVDNNLIDEISGQQIAITGKDWSGAIIPGTSTATLALPNTASLKIDDGFDGLWYTTAGAVRQVPINYLFQSDYYRTLVKYSNISPYNIEWIGLLKSDATLTSDELNSLHTYFQLSIYWSGVFNDFGFLKDNRELAGQGVKGWVARLNTLVLTNPTSAVISSMHKVFLDINNGDNILWGKIDAIWCFMQNDAALVTGAGTVSIKNLVLPRLTFPIAPIYTASGFVGNASTQYANTQLNPTTAGGNYSLNSASIFGLKYSESGTGAIFGYPSFTSTVAGSSTNSGSQRMNASTNLNSSGSLAGTEYFGISRHDATNVSVYSGTNKQDRTQTSSSIGSENIAILRNAFTYGAHGMAFFGLAGDLTQSQHLILRNSFIAHKNRLGL